MTNLVKLIDATEQVCIDFIQYVEDNYYYNSGGWINRETDEYKKK
jgi:hypothetical protein